MRQGTARSFFFGEGEWFFFDDDFRFAEGELSFFDETFRFGEREWPFFDETFRSAEGEWFFFDDDFRFAEGELSFFDETFRFGEREWPFFDETFRSAEKDCSTKKLESGSEISKIRDRFCGRQRGSDTVPSVTPSRLTSRPKLEPNAGQRVGIGCSHGLSCNVDGHRLTQRLGLAVARSTRAAHNSRFGYRRQSQQAPSKKGSLLYPSSLDGVASVVDSTEDLDLATLSVVHCKR